MVELTKGTRYGREFKQQTILNILRTGSGGAAMDKPIADYQAAITRILKDTTPLTEDVLHDLQPWVRLLPSQARESLQAELSLMQLVALRQQERLANRQLESFAKFDKATAKANSWMIGFTFAVTVMTLVILMATLYPLLR